MSKKKNLIKNTIVIAIGKICTQFISFFMLPLYTAFLTTGEYGIVDLITTYVSLLVPIITLQLENAMFRFLVDNRTNEEKKSKVITNIIYVVTKISICITIAFLIISYIVKIKYGVMLAAIILATIYSNIMLQCARGLGDNIGYSVGCVISGVSTILFNVIFIVFMKMNITGMLMSMFIANFLCTLYLLFKTKFFRNINKNLIDKKVQKEMLKYSIPLIPNSISWWVISVSDRSIISIFLGVAENGIYSIANKFSSILNSIISVYLLSWTEQASICIEHDDKEEFFSETINQSLKLFFSIGIIIISIMFIAFPVLIDGKYIEAYKYIPWLILAMIFNIYDALIGGVYIAQKNSKKLSQTSIYSAVINIIINIVLIKFIGLWAAVLSTVISYAAMSIYRLIDIRKTIKIKVNFNQYIEMIFIYCIVCLVYYWNNIYCNIISLIVVMIFSAIYNKEFIVEIKKYIISKIKKKNT